jgi:hypothetical protein
MFDLIDPGFTFTVVREGDTVVVYEIFRGYGYDYIRMLGGK